MSKRKYQFIEKYSPRAINEFIGNPAAIKGAFNFVKKFRTHPDQVEQRGIAIIGPIGVGKTRLAEYLAESRGMVPIIISASDSRRQNEIENFEILYQANMTHLFNMNHPALKKIKTTNNAAYLKGKDIGKALILDEVESITKGDKGLLAPLTKLLKDGPTSPNTLVIITLDTEEASKFKSLVKWCYTVNLKSPNTSEVMKIVNRVDKKEGWGLSHDVKLAFARNAQGDLRRLLTELEVFFLDMQQQEIENLSVLDVDQYFKEKELRIRDTTPVGILDMIIEDVRKSSIVSNTYDQEGSDLEKEIMLVELESYTLPVYTFDTYPNIVKEPTKKQIEDLVSKGYIGEEYLQHSDLVLDSMMKAIENISYSDVMYSTVRNSDPNAFSEDLGDFSIADVYRCSSVLHPLHDIKYVIPNTYKIDVSTTSKFYSVKGLIDSQYKNNIRMNNLSKHWFSRDREDWMFLRRKLFRLMANEKDWEECAKLLFDEELPLETLDELLKIRGDVGDALAEEGERMYKGKVKASFKKRYTEMEPKAEGLKFADEKSRKKITFFPVIKK